MGLFNKTVGFIRERLSKTTQRITSSLASLLTIGRKIDDELLEELEEVLICDDIGVETTEKLIEQLRAAYKEKRIENCE